VLTLIYFKVTGTFNCMLKFIVKDCDPNTGEPDNDEGYEDEYALESVEVNVADHVQKVLKPNFAASWEEIGAENELEDTYALSMPTLEGLCLDPPKNSYFIG
jgi:coatomer protein complex subunit gamma